MSLIKNITEETAHIMIDKQHLIKRFIGYVSVDTESDPTSDTTPSTAKQWDLANALVEELKHIGLELKHIGPNLEHTGITFKPMRFNLNTHRAKFQTHRAKFNTNRAKVESNMVKLNINRVKLQNR